MNDNPLISVIVPVYHVEKYLSKCVNSICCQTYKNLDIILVDDGGDDNCPIICENYKEKDNRVRVIHKRNGGLSDARNYGIEAAKGLFLFFVDSDDFIDNRTIEYLYNSLIENKSDISICEYTRINEDGSIVGEKIVPKDFRNVYYDEEIFHLYDSKELSWLIGVAWNKLYKREIFDEIRYPVGKIHEDDFVSHWIYSKVKKISFVYEPLYFYLQRSSSIMGESFSIKRVDGAEAQLNRILFAVKTKRYFMIEKSNRILLSILWETIKKSELTKPEARERLNLIISSYREKYPEFRKYCNLTVRENIIRYLMFNHIKELIFLRRIKRRK